MRSSSRWRTCFPFLAAVVVAGCRGARQEPATLPVARDATRPAVYVDNYPLMYFAQRIGGGLLEVVFPAPAGVDPAYWHPDDQVIQGYQAASLILLNGAGYAHWTGHVSLPSLRIVNTSRAFKEALIELEDQVVHRHGPEGEHAHRGQASTTWLDPRLALRQAEAILAACAKKWPDKAETFQAGWRQLREDLELLDVRLTEINSGYQGQPLLASHPVYQYLARRCGWNLQSLHWEPDELPADEQWRELEQRLKEHPARWMIWEGEPLRETAQRLQTLGIVCVVFEPCGNIPAAGDYLQLMHENLRRLRPALDP